MRILTPLCIAVALAACGGDASTPPPPPPTATSVTVSASAQSIFVGATTQLNAVATTSTGAPISGATFTWTSDNTNVASVNATGLVTGLAPGTVNIRATTGSATGAVAVTVTLVPVATIAVQPDTATLTIGDTRVLTTVLEDASGNALAGRTITFTSSDTTVATVRGGAVTAVSPGSVTISAAAEGKTGTARFTIVHGALPKLALQQLVDGMDGRFLASPPGDSRLFFATAEGRIWIIQGDKMLADPFLDISSKVSQNGNGVYSIAFHPRYATNGYVYIDYVDRNLNTQVERYTVSSDPNHASATSALPIITITHPPPFDHYGGTIAFGPDGKLFISTGDGGEGDSENAQNKSLLLGKILRLDVDGGSPYAIPSDNPFANGGGKPEIWAYGLRNPFRDSFDRVTGNFWVADVGQDDWEEVNVVSSTRAGADYGWNKLEGSHCSPVSTTGCSDPGAVLPTLEYTHPGRPGVAGSTHPTGCSVTGGYVYRGTKIVALRGMYFYGDFCAGWVRSFRIENGVAVDQQQWFDNIGSIIAFSEDASGELYVITLEKKMFRIIAQ